MKLDKPKVRTISASAIKTLETCSWLYFCQYVLKLPQKTNDGALRGTCVHLVLELFLKKRHKKHYDLIYKSKNPKISEPVNRLVKKTLKKLGALSTTNYDMCLEMISTACTKTDFFGKTAKLGEPEYEFIIENESPKYAIKGFIDKIFFYPDNSLKIVDYKTSKKKFKGDELEANIQAFMYSLAAYKNFKPQKVEAEFIFLRYPKDPVQKVCVTKAQLKGFEEYLAYTYEVTEGFDINKAQTNFAINSEDKKWLCKAGSWECPYLKSFEYYGLYDKNDCLIKSSFKNEFQPSDGQKVKKLRYSGCRGFSKSSSL